MKSDAGNNESSSAKTSTSARATEPPSTLSEAEFLKQEAARAQAAIGNAFADLKQNLKAVADPHVLTREHPWIAISAAAVAGFAAALTVVPTKEQQAMRALAELERARRAPPRAPVTSDKQEAEAAASAGIFATIAAEALKTLRPLLTSLLTAGISRAASAATHGETNGSASSAPGVHGTGVHGTGVQGTGVKGASDHVAGNDGDGTATAPDISSPS